MAMISMTVYCDTTGLYTEEECDKENLCEIDFPEKLVREWYESDREAHDTDIDIEWGVGKKEYTFENWLNSYTADSTDGLYDFCVARGFVGKRAANSIEKDEQRGEIAMVKITKYFTFDYENDTTIEYVNTGLYSMLNCSYTSEDPDYGTDTLHWTSSKPVPMAQIAYEMKNRLSKYCDKMDHGYYHDADDCDRHMFGDYSNSTLYAIEKALDKISYDYRPTKWYATIRDASFMMAKRFLEKCDVTFAFCESDRLEAQEDPAEHGDDGGWHGVKRIPGFFDNEPNEFIVAVGHYGGGNVGFGYADYNATDELSEISRAIRKAICEATGWDADNYIYIEEDEKEEK